MSELLMPPAQWAQNEFGFAQLGDRRRNQRLVNIAQHLAASPGGTLPQAFAQWAELKAAYRFFGQREVSFERVLAPHVERTRQACREAGEYLLIEDSTYLDYSDHRAVEHLGVIGDGTSRGFELHSALAMRVTAWTAQARPEGVVVGLFDQGCRRPRPAPAGESRGQRLSRPRKSQKWAAGLQSAGGPPPGAQWIYVADRESDCYEPIQRCRQHGVDYVIRACQNRRLAEGAGALWAALDQAQVLGTTTVSLRARPGAAARTAQVQGRSVRVDLDGPWRPGGKVPPLRGVGLVEVIELDPPAEVKEPLHWVLLTALPCENWAQLQRVVGCYEARWWVEEYHKALKSGTGVEASQLAEAGRLEALIAVLAVVAVRLLQTKFLARSQPESFEAAQSFGPEMITLLEKKLGVPEGGWTNRTLLRALARVGGFIGRKSDGEPGWQTIWRGWQKLSWMCLGAKLMKD